MLVSYPGSCVSDYQCFHSSSGKAARSRSLPGGGWCGKPHEGLGERWVGYEIGDYYDQKRNPERSQDNSPKDF